MTSVRFPIYAALFSENRTTDFPVKPEKSPARLKSAPYFLLVKDHSVALRQREASGLLAGLWKFPQVEGSLTAKTAAEQLKIWGIEHQTIQKPPRHKHIFSHIEWHMVGYAVSCKEISLCDPAFVWVKFKKSFKKPSLYPQPFSLLFLKFLGKKETAILVL